MPYLIKMEIINYINEFPNLANKIKFYTETGLLVSNGCVRVVSGGRGQYIEFNNDNIVLYNFHIPKDKKYKLNSPFVYYHEFRSNDNANIKLYHQIKTVSYADYKIGSWYISPKLLYTDYKITKTLDFFFLDNSFSL
jgi:hypothetical protein